MSTKPKKTTKKAVKKKAAKKKVAKKKATKKVTKKATTSAKKSKTSKAFETKTKELVLNARKRSSTPALFKSKKAKGNTPVVFTMEDVNKMLATRQEKEPETNKVAKKKKTSAAKAKKKTVVVKEKDLPVEHRNHGVASLSDILGFNPVKNEQRKEEKVARKYQKYYKALLALRDHVSAELELHTADTLKRSNKDDSGDLSSYGQHMADAGTDTFERDFALSLVSSEQEALSEIEEAIQRIYEKNYGICEITGQAIDKERLEAVPFTRYSLEGQRQLETNQHNKANRIGGAGGVFGDTSGEGVGFGEEVEDN